MNYCTRSTAECNSSLDHFHYRRPNILNYCSNDHQITVLLPNHTFYEEIEHNLVCFSETTSLISFDWFLSHEYLPNAKCIMVTSRWKTAIKVLFLCYFYPVLIGTFVSCTFTPYRLCSIAITVHLLSVIVCKILFPMNSISFNKTH